MFLKEKKIYIFRGLIKDWEFLLFQTIQIFLIAQFLAKKTQKFLNFPKKEFS